MQPKPTLHHAKNMSDAEETACGEIVGNVLMNEEDVTEDEAEMDIFYACEDCRVALQEAADD